MTLALVVNRSQANRSDELIQDSLMDVIKYVGAQLADKICQLFLPNRVIICVGPGNNGNDGLSLGAQLLKRGYTVHILDLFPEVANYTREYFKSQIPKNCFISDISNLSKVFDCTVVDAIFGVNQRFPLAQKVTELLSIIKDFKIKIAIDVPTGIDADSGAVEVKVQWDFTLCIQAIKQGLCIGEASVLSGKKLVVDCKIPIQEFNFFHEDFKLPELKRNPTSHKYFYGPVAIIGGSKRMPGAAKLATFGALCAGASFVHLHTATKLAHTKEAIFIKTKEFSYKNLSKNLSDKVKSIVFGPGVDYFEPKVFDIFKKLGKSCVIDAGGLKNLVDLNEQFILTPHVGELNSLIPETSDHIISKGFQLRSKYMACTLIKSNSFIYFGSRRNFILEVNNSKLSFGGVGDFLSGLIAGFLAQNLPIDDAVLFAIKLLSVSSFTASWSLDSVINQCREHVKSILH